MTAVTAMTPVAHAGHWYHAVLYLTPVVLVVVALWLSSLRERRAERERDADGESDGDAGPA